MLINFKQYNPSKPANYRLLYRCICDSEVQYTYFSLSYAGKPDEEYYVTWADNYTKFLVENVIRVAGSNSMKGRSISLDCFFKSISIDDWCLEKKVTITDTMRKDRIGKPREMK